MLTRPARALRTAGTGLAAACLLLAPITATAAYAAPARAAAAHCAHHTTGTCAANRPHPRGATAQCKDGTYSYSAHFRGTCSHHRGVRYWYR
ncbi:DUF3761 domain-containing protein [Streptomyces sp. NPDC001380]|uniref:DUF3761 domain-containing protein n=1 Tax=Streptomyces sp. NPDC001380 TaxID=3364566 RepID=UPI00369BBB0B